MRRLVFLVCVALLGAILTSGPAGAEAGEPLAAIKAVIAQWYVELGKREEGRTWGLVAPSYIDTSPPVEYLPSRSAALGPRAYTSLAATALKFAYEIDSVRLDPNFAKVWVWERGYFYAFAASETYESAASTLFILERQAEDGRWLILAHQSSSIGIPPNKITDPMPDLSHLYTPPVFQ